MGLGAGGAKRQHFKRINLSPPTRQLFHPIPTPNLESEKLKVSHSLDKTCVLLSDVLRQCVHELLQNEIELRWVFRSHFPGETCPTIPWAYESRSVTFALNYVSSISTSRHFFQLSEWNAGLELYTEGFASTTSIHFALITGLTLKCLQADAIYNCRLPLK